MALILIVAVNLVGCGGGGSSSASPQTEINPVLDRLENRLVSKNLTGFDTIFASTVEINGTEYTRDDVKLMVLAAFQEIDYLVYSIRNRQFVFNEDKTEAVVTVSEYMKIRNRDTGSIMSGTLQATYGLRKISGNWLIVATANPE